MATTRAQTAAHTLFVRSYGRRRTRRLGARQEALWHDALPLVRLDLDVVRAAAMASLFPQPVHDIWLEIGFGGGEHLVAQALAHPGVGFIGCEPFVDGVVKVLAAIELHGLRNILIHPDDARDVLAALPNGSLGRVNILFPDPWPKARHHKRRLVTRNLVGELRRVMRAGAELRLATDIGDYGAQMLESVLGDGRFSWTATRAADWRKRPLDWPSTRYEAKALHEGRAPMFLRFVTC